MVTRERFIYRLFITNSMANGNGYQEFRLDNGLSVVLQNTPTKTIYGKLIIHQGSISEKKGEQGLAHFLEHLIARGGTKKYGISKTDRIKGNFTEFNSGTNHVRSSYFSDFLSEDLDLFLDFISNIVFNPRLDSKKFDEEKEAVIKEINDALPNYVRTKKYHDTLSGKSRNYFTTGNEEVIRTTTIKDLRDFHSRGYYANNADLILVGELPKNIKEMVRKYFGRVLSRDVKLSKHPLIGPLKTRKIVRAHGPELYNFKNPEKSRAEIYVGIRTPGFNHEDHHALAVLTSILGGDHSSRIYKGVREKKGLAYVAGTSYTCSKTIGDLHIYTKTGVEEEEKTIDAIFDELRKLKGSPVNQAELNRIKKGTKYIYLKRHESNEGHLESIERKLESGIDVNETLTRINAVTLKDVYRVARKYLPNKNGNYVLMVKDPFLTT